MNNSWQNQLCALPVETVETCVLCDGTRGVPDPRWRGFLELMPPYDVLRCPACSLRWLSPRPNANGYAALYSDAMYFGGAGASPTDYAGLAKARVDYMRSRIGHVERMTGKAGSLSMLDYGAATGEFVRAAHDAGHACIGIELSDDARTAAEQKNGVHLLAAGHASELGDAQFDVVHMNHVLEHMPDPLAHLRWCARVLKSGGLLVSEVPNQFDNDLDRLRRLLYIGGKRPQFDAYSLHHTYFFTPMTMRMLLSKAGFEVVKLATFNSDKTPLWPVIPKNYLLGGLLGIADRLHAGGNIIEVFARRES